MDASQWPQHHQIGGLARTMEEIQPPNNIIMTNNMATISTNSSSSSRGSPMVERKVIRPQNKEQNLNCPRCNSTNTKFCYYNNYSLTQPRYFCKTCRRYWTQGGSLRNVPVGGGSRKNKRSSSSSPSILASSSSTPSKIIPDLNPPNTLPHLITTQNPSNKLFHFDAHDLNLAFPMQGSIFHHPNPNSNNNESHEAINSNISNSTPTTTTTTTTTTTALELLRNGMASRGNLNSYAPMSMPDPNSPLYPSGLPNLQEFKPSLGGLFPSSHGGDNGNNNNNNNNNIHGARLLFPFADMNKLASSAKSAHHNPEIDHHDHQSKGDDHHVHQHQHHDHHHHHQQQGQTGYYWSGMLGGGTW